MQRRIPLEIDPVTPTNDAVGGAAGNSAGSSAARLRAAIVRVLAGSRARRDALAQDPTTATEADAPVEDRGRDDVEWALQMMG